MGNIIRSLVSGFMNVVEDVFGAPLDFLSGKSCSSSCGSTWDLLCYIENFCVANLLKLVAVLFLFYIVLLFIYLVFKMGICGCLGRGTCKMLWASLSSCFSACEYGYMFLWTKLRRRKSREERFGDIEDCTTSSSSGDELTSERTTYVRVPGTAELRSSSMRSRERRRRMRMERSLRARSHRLRVGLSRGGSSAYVTSERSPRRRRRRRGGGHGRQHVKTVHDIRVTRTSKFVRKAGAGRFCRRRW